MSTQFISPNWHVILNHYPLALLTLGLIIEVFSFAWRRSTVRTAGRWMILLGALAMLPAAASGLYAFREVVEPGEINHILTWNEIVASSNWTDTQWVLMERHIWLTAAAVIPIVLAAVVWLASSNAWRDKLHVPILLVLILGFALVVVGSWHSGESIYEHGIAVAVTPHEPAHEHEHQTGGWSPATLGHVQGHRPPGQIDYYVPPLQLHLVLAGFTIAVALGALGLTIRRWNLPRPVPVRLEPVPARIEPGPHTSPPPDDIRLEPVRHDVPSVPPPPVAHVAPLPETVFPARVWLLSLVLAVGTILAGLWFTGDWQLRALIEPIENPFARQEMQRLFGHVLFGLTIVLLTLILAGVTRFAWRQRVVTLVIALLLLLAVIGQVWLGILMLFDSPTGPLTGFNPG